MMIDNDTEDVAEPTSKASTRDAGASGGPNTRYSRGKQKLVVNMSEDVAELVRAAAERKSITLGEVLRQAILVYDFIDQQRAKKNKLMIETPDKRLEAVHMLF